MKNVMVLASAYAVAATVAQAGGIDRSGQSVGVIFEQGNYVELSFGSISPSVSGVATAFSPTPGGGSGDMADDYVQFGAAYKRDLNNGLSMALIFDQPFGADVAYPAAPYFATGSTAQLKTSALTGVLKYTMDNNISVYGGLRYQTMEAVASIPFVAGYTANGERDGGTGYLVGVAWEKPEIAARVALTYNSAIDHSITTTEASALAPGGITSVTEVTSPKSVNLEFQSGIAADTLLFGSIRWVDWSSFDITPAHYFALTSGGSLVSYDNDTITYSIGLGRRFNENWSAAVTIGYEKQSGGFASNLGPTDGNKSIGLGATYTKGNTKITAGVKYVDIGNAQTTLGGGVAASDFTGNKAVAVGMKVGFSF